ncbi:MAG: LuxR C-terminal-related transcriptional regulator [Dongiaceae bacterium]
MNKLIRDFVADLEAVSHFDTAFDSLASAIADFGFQTVDYGFVRNPVGPNGKLRPIKLHLRNFPNQFEDVWGQFAVSDPMYLAGLRRSVPIDVTTIREWVCTDSRRQRAWSYLDRACLTQSVLIPMHLPGGGYATVAAYWRDRLPDDQWQSVYENAHDPIFVMAHHFHDTLQRLSLLPGESGEILRLTVRERECLDLIAQGKTTDEAAALLGRSSVTVRFHLGNAFKKLGATNRVGAIAEALKLGFISLH